MEKFKSRYELLIEKLEKEGNVKVITFDDLIKEDGTKPELKGNLLMDQEGVYLQPTNNI